MSRNSISTAQTGDPVFNSSGHVVGRISSSDNIAICISLDGVKEPIRFTRSFFAANRDRFRPSKKTLAAMPDLRDETLYLNRGA